MANVEKPQHDYPSIHHLAHHYFRILSNIIDGKLNNVVSTTLNTSSASTTISNSLCTVSSHISVVALTPDAGSALAGHYIKTRTNGSFVVKHVSTGTTQSYTVSYTITG